jgi:hypothetical protein
MTAAAGEGRGPTRGVRAGGQGRML